MEDREDLVLAGLLGLYVNVSRPSTMVRCERDRSRFDWGGTSFGLNKFKEVAYNVYLLFAKVTVSSEHQANSIIKVNARIILQ